MMMSSSKSIGVVIGEHLTICHLLRLPHVCGNHSSNAASDHDFMVIHLKLDQA